MSHSLATPAIDHKRAHLAQTAIDARLSEADDVTGSLGFMCGLKPGAEKYGAAGARGYGFGRLDQLAVEHLMGAR